MSRLGAWLRSWVADDLDPEYGRLDQMDDEAFASVGLSPEDVTRLRRRTDTRFRLLIFMIVDMARPPRRLGVLAAMRPKSEARMVTSTSTCGGDTRGSRPTRNREAADECHSFRED